ncbi:MAG: GNAT family N-acetyltransferase [Candidatus Competibacteraceae bacterium]|nr:GNAT family N-acetyltransferase [Candidatus Competibacteraceae bacterium]
MSRDASGPEIGVCIRPLGMDDYDAALAFWKSIPGMGLSSADSPEAIARFLVRNPTTCFACVDADGRLIGTALAGHDGRRGYLYHLAVAPDRRRNGFGSLLARACLDALRAEGIAKCHLFVFADNELGSSFWRVMGWKKRDDLAVYSKDLYRQRRAPCLITDSSTASSGSSRERVVNRDSPSTSTRSTKSWANSVSTCPPTSSYARPRT